MDISWNHSDIVSENTIAKEFILANYPKFSILLQELESIEACDSQNQPRIESELLQLLHLILWRI